MIEYMRTGAGVEQFNDEPGKQPPWEYSHNGKSFWKILEEDPECKQDFDLYMAARRQGDLVPEWFQLYPVGQELVPTTGNNVRSLKTGKDDVLFVDVAGGLGHDVTKFRAYFPQLPGRCVLQDLPKTIAQVRKNPPQGVELMEYDFFTPQSVKGKGPLSFFHQARQKPFEELPTLPFHHYLNYYHSETLVLANHFPSAQIMQ